LAANALRQPLNTSIGVPPGLLAVLSMRGGTELSAPR
jgi:hypothetical protein